MDTTQPALGEAVAADRKRRGKSRREYAALIDGVTENQVLGAEQGKRVRKDAAAALAAFLDPANGGPGQPGWLAEAEGHLPPDPDAEYAPGGPPPDEYHAMRAEAVRRHGELMEACGGVAPPIGWPAGYYRPDTAPPSSLPHIIRWCDEVEAWLIAQGRLPADGTGEQGPDGGEPPAAPEPPLNELEREMDESLRLLREAERSAAERDEAMGRVLQFPAQAPPALDDGPEGDPRGWEDPAESLAEAARGALATGIDPVTAPEAPASEHPHGWMLHPAGPEEADRGPADDGWELQEGVRYFTNSELRTFKECARKWWLGYYRKLGLKREKRTGHLSVGTRIHYALSGLYQPPGRQRDPFALLRETIDRDLAEVAAEMGTEEHGDPSLAEATAELRKEHNLCLAMLEGYMEWLAETGADMGLRVIGSEQRVDAGAKIPGRPDIRLLTRQDVRLLREADGARLFMDHKTTQSFARLFELISMDEQMLLYHLVEYLKLLEQGEDPDATRTDGALYNGLRKVLRTGTAKPPFYRREEVRHNTETLRSFWMRTAGTIGRIIEAEASLAAGVDHRQAVPPRPSSECSWKCEFLPVCGMLDDGSRAEGMLETLYTIRPPLDRYLKGPKSAAGDE